MGESPCDAGAVGAVAVVVCQDKAVPPRWMAHRPRLPRVGIGVGDRWEAEGSKDVQTGPWRCCGSLAHMLRHQQALCGGEPDRAQHIHQMS